MLNKNTCVRQFTTTEERGTEKRIIHGCYTLHDDPAINTLWDPKLKKHVSFVEGLLLPLGISLVDVVDENGIYSFEFIPRGRGVPDKFSFRGYWWASSIAVVGEEESCKN